MKKLDFLRRFKRGVSGALMIALPVIPGPIHIVELHAMAQDAIANVPAFEVASIKPGLPGLDSVRMQYTPNGFQAENVPVQLLIREAYGFKDDQILGLPSWAKTENYDVYAKVNSVDAAQLQNLRLDQRRAMLMPLLADRFKLIVHKESRSLPVYALVVAKGGPKLKEAKADATVALPQHRMSVGFGQISGQGVPISSLVGALSGQNLGRKIEDRTGLVGNYEIELKWSPETTQAQNFTSVEDGLRPPAPAPDAGPSIFTSLQEQLGLKLEPQKGSVDVIVVDHVEPPSPN